METILKLRRFVPSPAFNDAQQAESRAVLFFHGFLSSLDSGSSFSSSEEANGAPQALMVQVAPW